MCYVNSANPRLWKISPISEIFFNFFHESLEVLYTQVFYFFGLSHTKVFYIICDYCEANRFPNFFLILFIICLKEGYWFIWGNFISSYFADQLVKFSTLIFGVCLFVLTYHLWTVIPLFLFCQFVSPFICFLSYCSSWHFEYYIE